MGVIKRTKGCERTADRKSEKRQRGGKIETKEDGKREEWTGKRSKAERKGNIDAEGRKVKRKAERKGEKMPEKEGRKDGTEKKG